MSPLVTIKLREQDAEELAHGLAPRSARAAAQAALDRRKKRAERKASPKVKPTPRLKTASGVWGTKALRLAVWQRSEGYCENADCGRRITWETFDLDHYQGKARAPQSPENAWALCSRKSTMSIACHERKHGAAPSRKYWHRVFLLHLEQHGFGRSETARAIRDELAAEEQLAKAQEHSARAVTAAEDLAERARRAEGATDAQQ